MNTIKTVILVATAIIITIAVNMMTAEALERPINRPNSVVCEVVWEDDVLNPENEEFLVETAFRLHKLSWQCVTQQEFIYDYNLDQK